MEGFVPLVFFINGARGPMSDREWQHWMSTCASMSFLTRSIAVALGESRASRYAF